ncbi:MAG: Abi family protein [Muribaculaceae bacterium]|nr:Abi family protein [Muribaculaceae bacterium]
MKKALDISKQLQLLEKRGVVFDNIHKAEEILLDVGYYRLGFYAFPFERTFPNIHNRSHMYIEGTTFKSIYDLYLFDTKLRRLLLNALDRIEVNLRSRITYIVSNIYVNSPTWFVDRTIIKSDFVLNFHNKVYSTLLENPVIKRHHQKYINDRYAPAWKTLEFMTLGNLTALYQAIKDTEVKKKIASEYGCSLKVFVNYLETIRVIRNKCAHGSCLYNMELSKGIKSNPAGVDSKDRHNIKGAYSVIKYMLGTISNTRRTELEDNLKVLLAEPREASTNTIIQTCTNFSL